MSFGKCQRCEALGQVEAVGTLDGNTGTPVVLTLCSQCSKLYLHLNREAAQVGGQDAPAEAQGSPRRSRTTRPAEHPREGESEEEVSHSLAGNDTEST